jgi:iron complex outermembrane receptor protein
VLPRPRISAQQIDRRESPIGDPDAVSRPGVPALGSSAGEADVEQRRRAGRRERARAGVAVALLGVLAESAAAQEPAAPPPVTRRVPEVVVRAVEPAELPEDPTAFTTVIDVDEQRAEGKSVIDLLEESPGVLVRRFGGEGQPAEISIRGSTASQVVVQLDGVPLNSAQVGAVDLSTLPVGLLERIEVSRGGGSVQAGSDAIGGVVNLVTRRPGGPRRSEASFSGGSFDTYHGTAVTSGTARGLEYALGYDGFSTEGDFEFQRAVLDVGGVVIEPVPASATRINNESLQHAGLVVLGHDFGEKLHVTLRDQLTYGSRGEPGLDSGSVGEAGQREHAHERRTRNVLDATLDGADLGPLALGGALEFWHRYERVDFRDPDLVPVLGSTIDTLDRNDELGLRLGVEREWELWEMQHRVSLRGEATRDRLDSDTVDDEQRDEGAFVAQDDLALFGERLRLVPALRFDETEGFGNEWLPRIGVIATAFPWLHFKGNLERSFRVPTFDELFLPDRGFLRGNPALQPEEAVNGDVGLELGAKRLGPLEDAWLEAAWFHQDVRDSIVFVLVSPSLVEPRNTGEATIEGFEVAARVRLFEWIGFSAQYTHLDASLDRDGTPLPGRADDEAHFRVELGPPSRAVRLVGEAQLTSEIPVSESGNTVLPDRTVYDASLIVDLVGLGLLPESSPLDSLLVTLEGRNLGDRSVRDALFFPQPGRTLALRVETKW